MIKEEWRVHSTLFGNVNFALFPFIIILIGFLGGFFSSIFQVVFSNEALTIFSLVCFFFFGSTIGAFGISGQEFMNRRFGQASLLAYSSRSLPVSEKKIFFSMIAKDVVYYFSTWIFPLILGFFGYHAIFINFNITAFLYYLSILSLWFLLGLSLVFFLSTLYANDYRILIGFIVISIIAITSSITQIESFSDFIFHSNFFIASIVLIITFSLLSVIFAKFDFKQTVYSFKNKYSKYHNNLKFTKYRVFLSKDILDLTRSKGGFGKIIFSYLVPLIFIILFVDFFNSNVIDSSFSIMFSILLGIFSASIYTWITEHDLFSQYLFLPIEKSHIIKSKIFGFFSLNLFSYFVIIAISIFKNEISYLLTSLLVFSATSFYSLSLTIFLTGLLPSIRFMNAKVLLVYFCSIIPLMLILVLIGELFIIYLYPVLISISIIASFLLKISFSKWDSENDISF